MSGLAYSILSGFAVIPVFFGMTPYFPVKFNFFDEIFGSFFFSLLLRYLAGLGIVHQ